MSLANLKSRSRRTIERRDIPGVGDVWLRALIADEVFQFSSEKDRGAAVRFLIASSVLDHEGEAAPAAGCGLAYGSPDELAEMDYSLSSDLAKAILELNKLDLEEAKKNSNPTDGSAST